MGMKHADIKRVGGSHPFVILLCEMFSWTLRFDGARRFGAVLQPSMLWPHLVLLHNCQHYSSLTHSSIKWILSTIV